MKLLVDMNLSPRWVDKFIAHGIEAVHWSEVSARNAPDAEIMAFALASDCVVLTHDLDFSLDPAVDAGKSPQVAVAPEEFGRVTVTHLELLRSSRNRSESRANAHVSSSRTSGN